MKDVCALNDHSLTVFAGKQLNGTQTYIYRSMHWNHLDNTTVHAASVQRFKALVAAIQHQYAANAQSLLRCTKPDYWMKQCKYQDQEDQDEYNISFRMIIDCKLRYYVWYQSKEITELLLSDRSLHLDIIDCLDENTHPCYVYNSVHALCNHPSRKYTASTILFLNSGQKDLQLSETRKTL